MATHFLYFAFGPKEMPKLSMAEKKTSLVAGKVGTMAFALPFTGWRAEPFITEAIRFWSNSCNTRRSEIGGHCLLNVMTCVKKPNNDICFFGASKFAFCETHAIPRPCSVKL